MPSLWLIESVFNAAVHSRTLVNQLLAVDIHVMKYSIQLVWLLVGYFKDRLLHILLITSSKKTPVIPDLVFLWCHRFPKMSKDI